MLETERRRTGVRSSRRRIADQVRSAMIDAVRGPIGRLYAGAGRRDALWHRAARADRRQDGNRRSAARARQPHSWFIGFAPAQDGATPSIAIAVIVEGGGSGSGHAAPIGGAIMAEWLKLRPGG